MNELGFDAQYLIKFQSKVHVLVNVSSYIESIYTVLVKKEEKKRNRDSILNLSK